MRHNLLITFTFFFLSLAHANHIAGTYEVPVKNPDLQDFARFQVTYDTHSTHGYMNEISFDLPVELTGAPNHISLKFVDNRGGSGQRFEGPLADGRCHTKDNAVNCELKFKNLKFDAEGLQSAILTKFPNPILAEKQFEVAASFSGEPQGILNYSYPSK